ncbi:type VII secretion target [Nocardia sp. NPDC019395]|uniref:type VII secretion target n=1 Tax=Nocardia sp. NPDC019395 TaxID=3154686 RepID=UPI0033F57076
MPEWLDIDPQVLRQLALQHDQVAAETREWAKPPSEWLALFEPTYGKIAFPVKEALERYYDARQRAGEALAREHEQTAYSLRKSADDYERTDDEGAALLRPPVEDSTVGGGTSGSGPAVGSPIGTSPNGASRGDMPDAFGGPRESGATSLPAASATPPPGTATPAGPAGPTAADGAAAPGQGGATAPPSGATATPGTPVPPTEQSAGSGTPTANAGPGSGPATAGDAVHPGGPVGGAPVGSGSDDRGSGTTPAGTPTPVPVTPLTPFNSAVDSAKDREAEPNYIVGDAVNEDLVIAKTLLGAVLAATDSAVGMTWSVAVMRGPAGAGIFINSNEGRGWLPAGLYLPRQVSTPWLWDELLAEDGDAASPWEGVSDPARVLAEFGMAWGAKANAVLSALVSSGPIDPGLQGRFGDVAMQGMVGPSDDVDLRVLTPDTVDRLGLTGSVPALESVSSVPDARVRARCIELAVDAHTQLGRSLPGYNDTVGARSIRDRILAKVEAGEEVPGSWWEELRDADDLLAAAMISQRVDVGRVDIGAIRVDDEVNALRAMVWERRCNELVALLEQEPDRQVLRDAVYAHSQVSEHPSFVAAPAPVSTGVDERVDRPAGGTTGVSAPSTEEAGESVDQGRPGVAGPPSGAVVAPDIGAGPPSGAVAPSITPPPEFRNNS